MAKKNQNLTDRELRQLLSSFKEEVAAPPHFRANLMKRLAADRGLAPREESPSLAERLGHWLRVPGLVPTAAALVLALAIWTALKTPEAAQQASSSTELSTAGRQTVAAGQRPAANPPASASSEFVAIPKPSKAPAVQPALPEPSKAGAEELAKGQRLEAPAAPAPQAPRIEVPQFSSNGSSASSGSAPSASVAQDKPILIEISPTKTPLATPLRGNSEVRRSKFLASRGEYCAILFKMDFPGQARVEIYDRLGRVVDVPLDSMLPAGIHEVKWHGHNKKGDLSATGVYLVRVKAGRTDERHKVVLVK